MTTFVNNIEDANEYLSSAVINCIYRVNGQCWQHCRARSYCDPQAQGLKTVQDLDALKLKRNVALKLCQGQR